MLAKVKIFVNNGLDEVVNLTTDTLIPSVDSSITVDAVSYDLDNRYISLDLFKDETISLTSTLQDISDISKTFMDYSKSFNVPASPTNKGVFAHWENNKLDNGFDARKRYGAYITLGGSLYRSGVIQLEKVTIKDNSPENYTITFFGNLLSLKDIFNGLLLKDLKALPTTFVYSGTNVFASTQSGSKVWENGIVFPLISSSRNWNYGTGDNINSATTPIGYKELFPALTISTIFKMIEAQFGIKFKGNFLNNPRFTYAYLWLKNVDKFVSTVLPVDVTFNSFTYTFLGSIVRYLFPYPTTSTTTSNGITINGNTRNYNLTLDFYFKEVGTGFGNQVPVTIQMYRNGSLYTSRTFTTINVFQKISFINSSNNPTTNFYTFKVVCDTPFNFQSYIDAKLWQGTFYSSSTFRQNLLVNQTTSIALPGNLIDLSTFFPEMKIEDFFTGLMKTWNLTCYGSSPTEFTLETINDYYAFAKTVDLTKYIKTNTIEIERIKWYKRIAFTFQKGSSYMQSLFWGVNNRGYGDLSQGYDADGTEFKIELPFEKLLFENLGRPNLVIGKSINNTLQSYVPKPILLYDLNDTDGNIGVDFIIKINNGASTYDLSRYVKLGNEYLIGNQVFSNNWGTEASVSRNISVTNSLYLTGYLDYLLNLYDKKARMLRLTCNLPLSIAYSLKLSNRIIIKDKRYLINSFTTDLSTSETKLELIEDFREAEEYGETMFFDDYKYVGASTYVAQPIVGQGDYWNALNGNLNGQVLVYNELNERYYPRFLDYRSTNISNFFVLWGQVANPQSIYHNFTNIRTGKTYFSFMASFSVPNAYVYNTWNRITSVRTFNGTTDYCNLFVQLIVVGANIRYKFGLSNTSLTTPDAVTTLDYPAFPPTSPTINFMLFVLRQNAITNTLDLFVFDNYTGQYNTTLLPNIEPTTSDCSISIASNIVPEKFIYHQPTNNPAYVVGTRISNIWDIKF